MVDYKNEYEDKQKSAYTESLRTLVGVPQILAYLDTLNHEVMKLKDRVNKLEEDNANGK